MKKRVKHKTVFLDDRGHSVDVLVLPFLKRLWEMNINTYYSCQGGITYIDEKVDKVYYTQAYAMIHIRDLIKACQLLGDSKPMVEISNQRANPGLVSVRFVPSEEARRGIPRVNFEHEIKAMSSKNLKLKGIHD